MVGTLRLLRSTYPWARCLSSNGPRVGAQETRIPDVISAEIKIDASSAQYVVLLGSHSFVCTMRPMLMPAVLRGAHGHKEYVGGEIAEVPT